MLVILCIYYPRYCQLRAVFTYTDKYAVRLLNYLIIDHKISSRMRNILSIPQM